MKKQAYLSGAITNEIKHREIFDAAEKKYKDKGYEIINPVSLGDKLAKMYVRDFDRLPTYAEYLIYDLEHVADCQAIILLENWKSSKGARAELQFADALGIPVIYDIN